MISRADNTQAKNFKKNLRGELAQVFSRKTVVAVTCQFSVSSSTPIPDAQYKTMLSTKLDKCFSLTWSCP